MCNAVGGSGGGCSTNWTGTVCTERATTPLLPSGMRTEKRMPVPESRICVAGGENVNNALCSEGTARIGPKGVPPGLPPVYCSAWPGASSITTRSTGRGRSMTRPKPPIGGSVHVESAGKGKTNEEGKLFPLAVKERDSILFGKYSGTEIKLDGGDFLIMKEEEVLGIVTGTAKKESVGARETVGARK